MKRRMEISQHCWKFIYKHSDIILLYVTDFIFYKFFYLYTGVGKIILQINPVAVAFIGILMAAWEGLNIFVSLLAFASNLWCLLKMHLIATTAYSVKTDSTRVKLPVNNV